MAQIAREYMERMGIRNTQFIIVRHTDQAHPHCHIVYNRVGNDGQTISDKNIKIRNGKVCKELTAKYGLYYPKGKEQVRRERLRRAGQDQVRHLRRYPGLSARLQVVGRSGETIAGTRYYDHIQVLRQYRPQAGRIVWYERLHLFRLEDRPGFQLLQVRPSFLAGTADRYSHRYSPAIRRRRSGIYR